MMNSTPLSALNRNEEQDPNTRDMVANIVNEIDDRGGATALPPGDPRGGMYPPQFDDMQGDPNGMYDDYQVEYGPPQNQGYYGGGPQYPQQPQYPQPRSVSRADEGFVSSFSGGSMTDCFTKLAKEPLIVAVLFFVLSNSTVASMIESYIPYSYGLTFGLVVRSLIAGVLFLVTKMFVLRT